MRKHLIIYCLILISGINLYSQNPEELDSTFNFDDFNLDSLNDDFKPDEFMQIYYSKGWFPIPIFNHFNMSAYGNFGGPNDYADDIRSSAFIKTNFPYTNTNPMEIDEQEIYKSFNKQEKEDDYPQRGLTGFGFDITYGTFLPASLRLQTGLNWQSGMLFSEDKSKHFLNREGEIKELKEVGVIYLDEVAWNWGAGLQIPIYGGYLKTDDITTSSIYYLYAGYSSDYMFISKGSQYMQIASPKDQIRYKNGTDTTRLLNEVLFKGLNRKRDYINLAVGFDFEANNVGISFELNYSYPLTSVLNDASWKQHILTFRVGMKFLGFFKL